MQNEGPFWRNTVKPQFDKLGLFYKRIESPITAGFCDTIVLYKGFVTLLELKSKDEITLRFGLNPLQKIFLESWNANAGHAYILTRIGPYIHLLRTDIDIPKYPDRTDLYKHSLVAGTSREFDWSLFLRYMHLDSNGFER